MFSLLLYLVQLLLYSAISLGSFALFATPFNHERFIIALLKFFFIRDLLYPRLTIVFKGAKIYCTVERDDCAVERDDCAVERDDCADI